MFFLTHHYHPSVTVKCTYFFHLFQNFAFKLIISNTSIVTNFDVSPLSLSTLLFVSVIIVMSIVGSTLHLHYYLSMSGYLQTLQYSFNIRFVLIC